MQTPQVAPLEGMTPLGVKAAPIELSSKSTAALLKKILADKFPKTKFSCRSDRGSSVDVSWTDGPTGAQVEAIIKPFEGRGFDGMTDSNYRRSNSATYAGVSYRPAFTFIFAHRELSDRDAKFAAAKASIMKRFGILAEKLNSRGDYEIGAGLWLVNEAVMEAFRVSYEEGRA